MGTRSVSKFVPMSQIATYPDGEGLHGVLLERYGGVWSFSCIRRLVRNTLESFRIGRQDSSLHTLAMNRGRFPTIDHDYGQMWS